MENVRNHAKVVAIKEVFITLKIDTKAGRRVNTIRPDDYYANTNLARLLAKAHVLENKLISKAGIPFG